jgi:hypothetical protein
MILFIGVAVYVLAMVLANLSVLVFGPVSTPFNAFFLIGLDLSLRDYLHVRLSAIQMVLLISISGLIAWALNPAAGQIAVASAISFTAAGVIDWGVFAKSKGSWLSRANKSNTAGAAVDSILFPTLAFGVLMPWVIVGQFVAKTAGGFVWALAIKRIVGGDLGSRATQLLTQGECCEVFKNKMVSLQNHWQERRNCPIQAAERENGRQVDISEL